jgi:glyoxylase-like metal-dependent hydrolase (beta-lactamase superfamily II)
LIVKQMAVGTMANFVYLLVEPKSGEALVVDSGWETAPIVKAVEELDAEVKFVVATHEHFDHTSTLGELAERLGAKVVVHENSPIDHDVAVVDGEELKLGRKGVKVLHTPGHTEDSICLYDGKNLFTGDTLFVGAIGKFEREMSKAMYDSLHQVIMKLPDSAVIYPGHDYGEVPFRTLGEEKAVNPFLLVRDIRSFLSLFA